MQSIAFGIREYNRDLTTIYASVTPGGGKSALPAILADTLIGSEFDLVVWVVPRASLRDQGEEDYCKWAIRTNIRAASNSGPLYKGLDGYVTTYQAIVADPALHAHALDGKKFILFLDEPHHVAAGGEWYSALWPLVSMAKLLVLASGTFSRGDGQPVAFIRYDAAGLPIFDGEKTTLVRYSRSDALRDGAIVPVHFRHIDGSAEWEQDGERASTTSLSSGDYAPQALFTALRTEYALGLLDACIADWRQSRDAFPGKLLVVAPNIEFASSYLRHLRRRGIEAEIATSDDSQKAHANIARFKHQLDCLVTVGMAYEGLSVPAISHIACLTHIRSIPWLEQCFARANRTCPGKTCGIVYGPADPRFSEAIRNIEEEQAIALKAQTEDGRGGDEESKESGQSREWITPIGSAAHVETAMPLFTEPAVVRASFGGLPPSKAEKLLRKQISDHIDLFLASIRPGSKAAYTRILHAALKMAVNGKSREECSVDELVTQLALLKDRWPLEGKA